MFITRPSHPGPTVGRQVNPSEVGWQFVPQYYTFVNKQPNRLHCFYAKNSTFVNGTEGEDGKACYGQHEIHQKIQSLNYQDCKVLIHSVDAQSSANNGIIIQVIGEMSNRGEPWKKFVQTFFLAEQPKGYFVLNDIFRFLKDDTTGEEDKSEAVAEPEPVEPIITVPSLPIPAAETAVPTVKAPTSAHAGPLAVATPFASAAAAVPTTPATSPVPSGPNTWTTLADLDWGSQTATDVNSVSATAPRTPATSPPPMLWRSVLVASDKRKRDSRIAMEAKNVSAAAPRSPATWGSVLVAKDKRKQDSQIATQAKDLSASLPRRKMTTGPDISAKGLADTATGQCFVKATEDVKAFLREMLISHFGQELEVVRFNGCTFLEFTSPEAAQKAIQASLPVSRRRKRV
ncbi:hypothetical protein FRB95_001105 [Tulasnella sp. JGI-2019a]|nr:hypothetical protein FRB95_001105 [Tulasnella sp. JGI-2019a]